MLLDPLLVDELVLDEEEVDDDVLDDEEVEDEVLTPLEVELLEVVEIWPLEVLVEEPPVEVEVDEPPVEVLDDTPLEVETPLDVDTLPLLVETWPLLVETWPLLVEVDEMSMLIPLDPELPLLPELPKKPPAKKPPMKPPPPPDPPTTELAAAAPPPPPIATPEAGRAGGSGIGVPWVVTVTTAGGHCAWVCVTTRRTTRRTGLRATVRRTTRFWGEGECAVTTRRGCAVSATCTAPPPTIAPPHAQAQSFAKAIRTDMMSHSSVAGVRSPTDRQQPSRRPCGKSAKQSIKFKCVNHCLPNSWMNFRHNDE